MVCVDPLWVFGGMSAQEMRACLTSTFAYYQFFNGVHATMEQV